MHGPLVNVTSSDHQLVQIGNMVDGYWTTKSWVKPYLSLLDKEPVPFAAVEVVNPVDDSIVLPLVEVKLYPYPISSREISRPDEFDLQHPARV